MTTTTLLGTRNDALRATGMMASMLAGITLLVGASVDALGIYFYNWPGSSLLLVFALGYLAFLIGLRIEGRAARQR